MMSGLDLERAWVSVGCTGTAERAIDLAVGWAQQRVQFGKPIGSFQLIQDKLARMYTAHASSQLLVYKALAACEAVEAGGAGRGEIHKLTTAACNRRVPRTLGVHDASPDLLKPAHRGPSYDQLSSPGVELSRVRSK